MNIILIFILFLIEISYQDMGFSTQCDSRPLNIMEIEQICLKDPEVISNPGSLLDKIQENVQSILDQAKKLFNVAKKKIGLDSNDDNLELPKKCEYYMCIFKKMGVLITDSYLNKTILNQWVEDNVENANDKLIYPHIDNCFKNLTINSDNREINENKNITNTCISSLNLMDCLNSERLCPIFKFP